MARRRWLGVLLAACAATAGAATSAGPPASEPVPVLVLSGANNHDWEWTSASLRTILAESGRFDVSVTFDPGTALVDPEALARFRAFVLDYNGPRWGEPAETNFLDAVRAGAGVAVIHAANNAFEGWRGYEELVGDLWREGTGHGGFHAFDVAVVDRAHPITRGMADLRAHPDELYHGLVRTEGTAHRVLARAFSDPATGGTGRREPVLFAGVYGAGRVFHTTLGHVWPGHETSRASHADPAFRDLVVRGVEWAATGEVTERAGAPNHLTRWERRAGWRLLFDGRTTRGWRPAGGGADEGAETGPPSGWSVVDGTLRHEAGGDGGPLASVAAFDDFELELEWQVAPGATGAVRYRSTEREVRLGDDGENRAGGWRRARILAVGERVEHWLDGRQVLAARTDADASGARDPAPIVLVGEGGEILLRSVRIREPYRLPGEEVALLEGSALAGWSSGGEASFRRGEDGAIHGEAAAGARGALVSQRSFDDFVLELDMAIEPGAGVGIVVRDGYDVDSRAAQGAFRPGHWNHCRIECVGPTVRAWVNGIPVLDDVAVAQREGSIALEVLGGEDGRARWRDLRLWDLGE